MSARVGGLITLHLIKPSASGSIWSTVTSVSLHVREWTHRQPPTLGNLPPPIKGDWSDTALRCHATQVFRLGEVFPGIFFSFSLSITQWTGMEMNAEWLSLLPLTLQCCCALQRNQVEVHYVYSSWMTEFPVNSHQVLTIISQVWMGKALIAHLSTWSCKCVFRNPNNKAWY